MKSIRVQVEYNDIASGCSAANACPIAKAIGRHGISAMVTHSYIQTIERVQAGWGHKTIYKFYYMPPLIRDWIKVYDRGEGVLPIDFELNLDNPYLIKERLG